MAVPDKLLADVDALRAEIIAFHQALIRFETVNTGVMPTGNETACCEYIQRRLRAEDIESEILESAPGRGNLIARLKGSGRGPSLLFMSHLDVVPVEDPGVWQQPPFSGNLVDGKIWGRGSDDYKSGATAGYFATVLLRRHGVPLNGDVVFTATADEESGGKYGYGWLAKHAPDKIRTDYALNEGGGLPLPSQRGLLYGISLGEKGRAEVTISISGRSAHASRPWTADNALVKAARVITALAGYAPRLDVSHPMFDRLDDMVAGLPRPTAATLESVLVDLEKVDAQSAGLLRAMSRMTLTPTVLRAGVKSNSIPASAVLTCDCRMLPGQDGEYVKREVEGALRGIDGIRVDVEVWARSTQSPFNTPFTDGLGKALQQVLGRGDLKVMPTLTTGFTDSQFVRPLGVQAYGFSPIHPGGNTVRSGVHGVDENIEVDALLTRTKFFVAAAYLTTTELAGP